MDTTSTTFSRGVLNPRDHGAHRRVYLDTYAKRRSGAEATETKAAAQQPDLNQVSGVAIPSVQQSVTQPAVEPYITTQPAADGFTYNQNPHIPADEVTRAPADEVPQDRRQYLDTLARRYQAAVAEAPAAAETVIEPTLPRETEALLDDPVAEARMEANLNALYSSSLTDIIEKNTTSASAAHVRTIIASAAACGILSVGIFSFLARYDAQPVVAQPIGAPVIEVESSNTQKPAGTSVANASGPVAADPTHPIRLVISSIGVNAPVEGLGTTPEGLIAVPKSYGVVGWYNKGAVPGKPGPAVLVGHYTGGNNGVFDKLKNLKNGDLITTTNGRGQSYTYRVTVMQEYEKDKVPMAQLFKSGDESRLEIITCSGKWQSNNYTNRLVVTAELVK